ncbi:hypothetical protein WN51_13250 [Melipona quadrifasciata]|uniref:Uncharacterized protein n=1 Tax=Melipona quadrifasciata TaxID=166423 RepID=A0A0M9A3N7_9HYME|nr:hypothetical protein WN51_13250 [Melipona quadrifasciata]
MHDKWNKLQNMYRYYEKFHEESRCLKYEYLRLILFLIQSSCLRRPYYRLLWGPIWEPTRIEHLHEEEEEEEEEEEAEEGDETKARGRAKLRGQGGNGGEHEERDRGLGKLSLESGPGIVAMWWQPWD